MGYFIDTNKINKINRNVCFTMTKISRYLLFAIDSQSAKFSTLLKWLIFRRFMDMNKKTRLPKTTSVIPDKRTKRRKRNWQKMCFACWQLIGAKFESNWSRVIRSLWDSVTFRKRLESFPSRFQSQSLDRISNKNKVKGLSTEWNYR